MANTSTTELDLLKTVTVSGGGTDQLVVTGIAGSPVGTLIQNTLVKVAYDYIAVTYPSGTQEVYTFKTGGSGGTTVATVTINYVDSTKVSLLNVSVT